MRLISAKRYLVNFGFCACAETNLSDEVPEVFNFKRIMVLKPSFKTLMLHVIIEHHGFQCEIFFSLTIKYNENYMTVVGRKPVFLMFLFTEFRIAFPVLIVFKMKLRIWYSDCGKSCPLTTKRCVETSLILSLNDLKSMNDIIA